MDTPPHGHGSIDSKKILEFFEKLSFPAEKHDLQKQAEEHGADDYIMDVLSELPNYEYDSPADALSRVNEMHG